MSEKRKAQEKFLDTVAGIFPAFFSFSFSYRDKDPALVGKMYDVVLWQKGFIGASITALRKQVEASSGDKEALGLAEDLAIGEEPESPSCSMQNRPTGRRGENGSSSELKRPTKWSESWSSALPRLGRRSVWHT